MRQRRLDPEIVVQARDMDLRSALGRLDLHVSVDRDFKPIKDVSTERWVVSGEFGTAELLVTGPKWFDTRSGKGGGGAVDLAIHLLGLKFIDAVRLLAPP